MLILTRLAGESIIIGNAISITVRRIEGSELKIGVGAPRTDLPTSVQRPMQSRPRPKDASERAQSSHRLARNR